MNFLLYHAESVKKYYIVYNQVDFWRNFYLIPLQEIVKMEKSEKKIKNPCRLVCKYDHESICMGCYRTREEIANWANYSDEEKLKIFDKIIERGGNPYAKKRYTF